VILLDTNALLWLLVGHPRAGPLQEAAGRLYLSPVSLLELKFLLEAGKLSATAAEPLSVVAADPRWQLDSPSADSLFASALPLEWTRDPFDRLLVAHAHCRRWKLATGDRRILAALPAGEVRAL